MPSLQARLLGLAGMRYAGWAAGKYRAIWTARMREEDWTAGCCTARHSGYTCQVAAGNASSRSSSELCIPVGTALLLIDA
jgi:fructose-1,6-bisphosphatase/inositol monophosphatase family enzyme